MLRRTKRSARRAQRSLPKRYIRTKARLVMGAGAACRAIISQVRRYI